MDSLEGAFSVAREQNPILVGKHAACAELWSADFTVLGASAPRTQFLITLGMSLPQQLADLVGKEYNAPLSTEKVDLLDVLDVLVWTTEHDATTALLEHEFVRNLRTTKEGDTCWHPMAATTNSSTRWTGAASSAIVGPRKCGPSSRPRRGRRSRHRSHHTFLVSRSTP